MNLLRKPEAEGRTGVRVGLGSRLAMFGLALVGLVGFEGCQSGCGGCGLTQGVTGFTQRVGQSVSNLGARVFHRNKYAAVDCCEGGTVIADPGMPAGTILPGPVIQSPGAGSTGTEVSPELTPAPTSKPSAPAVGSQGAVRSTPGAVNARMSYETDRPVVDGPRSASSSRNVAGAMLGGSASPAPAAGSNPLDNLPPVELPRDIARRANSAPVPVEAEALTPPTSARTGDAETKAAEPAKPVVPTSASAAEPPGAAPDLPAPLAFVDANRPTGIARFTAVGPRLAAGSIPDDAGLAWLRDKGYCTFLDLREPSEIRPEFVDSVIDHGLRYVPLPLALSRLDTNRVNRFRDELAQQDARPLYFCDKDGARPALLWYVHRVGEGGVEPSTARREAEEIAPLDESALAVAAKLLDGRAASAPAPTTAKVETAGGGPVGRSVSFRAINEESADLPLAGRSAVLEFTAFSGERGRVIPEPKSVGRRRVAPGIIDRSND